MVNFLAPVELTVAWLFKNSKGRDEKSFYRSEAFKDFPEPTIEIISPECGPGSPTQPAELKKEHSADGAGKFPSLEWKTPEHLSGKVKEWLIVSEDVDAPLPTPIPHG